jgi:hypothetical protein
LTAGTVVWQTEQCGALLPFICERNPPFTFAETHHAYRLMTGKTTFDGARSSCESTGGYLARLETKEELSFVAGRVVPQAWVGGTDSETEGTFRWLDGALVDATQFQTGQPDNQNGAQDCLFLMQSALADASCTMDRFYICEYE